MQRAGGSRAQQRAPEHQARTARGISERSELGEAPGWAPNWVQREALKGRGAPGFSAARMRAQRANVCI